MPLSHHRKAAARMKAIRESIIKAFDALSETIDSTNVYIRFYSSDVILQQKAEDLYIAILEAVKGITEWLKKNPLGKMRCRTRSPTLLTDRSGVLQGFLPTE